MAQRLAAMPLRIETEVRVELLQSRTQVLHLIRRPSQAMAGPQAGMDADSGVLSLLSQQNDHKVNRNAAMNAHLALCHRHQGNVAARLEIAHRAKRAALVGPRSRDA